MHHGAGRRGGNANDIGFALLHKINHLAGQGRNRDCLHNAASRLQYLREHHGSDFIRLAASGQGEDTKPRRVDQINQAGIRVCLWRVLRNLLRLHFLLAIDSVLNHLLQAFHDELVLSIVDLAAMPMRLGQGQCGDEHRVVDFGERPVLKQILQQFVCLFLISRHESLIDAFLRLKNGLIAQQNVQEG